MSKKTLPCCHYDKSLWAFTRHSMNAELCQVTVNLRLRQIINRSVSLPSYTLLSLPSITTAQHKSVILSNREQKYYSKLYL